MGCIPGKEDNAVCLTCALKAAHCPGHWGVIELAVPVYHPLLFADLLTALRAKCWNCHRFRAELRPLRKQQAKFWLLHNDHLTEYQELEDRLARAAHEAKEAVANQQSGEGHPKVASQRAANSAVDRFLQDILPSTDREQQGAAADRRQQFSSYHRQQRRMLVQETLQMLRSAVRCHHCGAYSPKLRHDSHSKIFQVALSAKARRLNAAEKIQFAPAMTTTTTTTDETADNTAGDFDGDDEYNSDDTRTNRNDAMDTEAEEVKEEEEEDDDDDDEGETNRDGDKYLNPLEVQAQLKRLWQRHRFLCNCLFGASGSSWSVSGWKKFFMQAVPVPPNRFRPPMELNGMPVLHSQTGFLGKILELNILTRDRFAASDERGAYTSWIDLQTQVNCLMDSSKDPSATGGRTVAAGIRQVLERKEGLFRKNMMGKRVDYACRSVISPDPYVGTNEIGLPQYFATVLTYPTKVTDWNVSEMRKLVERGPHSYPGARWVEIGGTGRRIDLQKMNAHKRQAVAAQLLTHLKKGGGRPVIVGRQLRDGDYVLMNRQVCISSNTSQS
jgi:DNA-directed RNA polymerase I subunit RPA1